MANKIECVETQDVHKLFSHKRLDLVIKYLFAKEMITSQARNDFRRNHIESLYIRHILMRNKGFERSNAYSKTEKFSVDDFVVSYGKLISSLRDNGFMADSFIPIDDTNLLWQGAHRLAGAKALGMGVYIERIAKKGQPWGFEWFLDNGFSTEDKMRILKGFIEIKPDNTAIFIIWNPIFRLLDNIKALIESKLDIVGDIELDFENNYVAFNNAVLDIYETNNLNAKKYEVISEKARLLQANHLSFKVLVVTDSSDNIHEKAIAVKEDIRELVSREIPKKIFATVHSSDSARECKHLAAVLLSPNNIYHLNMRLNDYYNEDFLRLFDKCREVCDKIGVSTDEICLVGSSPMVALGMKKFADLDFVTTSGHRSRLGHKSQGFGGVDMAKSHNEAAREKDVDDDILIGSSDCHFVFNGFKVINLEIIKSRKGHNPREKDKQHIRQIELFEKLTGYRIQQNLLMQRINDEQERRDKVRRQKKAKTKLLDSKKNAAATATRAPESKTSVFRSLLSKLSPDAFLAKKKENDGETRQPREKGKP